MSSRHPLLRQVSGANQKASGRRGTGFGSIWMVRTLLLVQIAIFLVLMSIHFGALIGGHRHQAAGTTEALISAVLILGLLFTWTFPPWSRRAATAAQCFAALGASVGLIAIALGIGSRTILDLSLNVILLLTLGAGLTITMRSDEGDKRVRGTVR